MPRPLRPIGDGLIYHVINRGNNRQNVFHKMQGQEKGRGKRVRTIFQGGKRGTSPFAPAVDRESILPQPINSSDTFYLTPFIPLPLLFLLFLRRWGLADETPATHCPAFASSTHSSAQPRISSCGPYAAGGRDPSHSPALWSSLEIIDLSPRTNCGDRSWPVDSLEAALLGDGRDQRSAS
jgi:hypothetical protein